MLDPIPPTGQMSNTNARPKIAIKAFGVDTLGTILFFTIVAGLTELLIAGMDWQTVLTTRLITIPMMVLTGRPYGMWRDLVFWRLTPRHTVTRMLTDILAFLTFQVPVYVGTLFIAGARLGEIQVAVGAAVFFMIALSRPFGIFLEALRRWAGTSA